MEKWFYSWSLFLWRQFLGFLLFSFSPSSIFLSLKVQHGTDKEWGRVGTNAGVLEIGGVFSFLFSLNGTIGIRHNT